MAVQTIEFLDSSGIRGISHLNLLLSVGEYPQAEARLQEAERGRN